MSRNQKISFFFISLCSICLTIGSWAQQSDSPHVSISVDRKNITIGETFTLEIIYVGPRTVVPVEITSINDSIGHFEVLGRISSDSAYVGERVEKKFTCKLTGFDSGHWVIPPIPVVAGNSMIFSDTLAIDIGMIALQGNDYNDIRDIMEPEVTTWDWKPWLAGSLVGLLLIASLLWYLRKRRRSGPRSENRSGLSPYAEAVNRISALQNEVQSGNVPVTLIQERLYEVLRFFLHRHFGLSAMSASTSDLLVRLKGIMNSPDNISTAAELLRIADAVKFAKYPSSKDETMECLRRMKGFITMLNELKN